MKHRQQAIEKPSGPRKYKAGFLFEDPIQEQCPPESDTCRESDVIVEENINYSFRKSSSDPAIFTSKDITEEIVKEVTQGKSERSPEKLSSVMSEAPANCVDSTSPQLSDVCAPPPIRELDVKGLVFGDIIFEEAPKSLDDTNHTERHNDPKESIIIKDTKNVQLCHLIRSATDPIIVKSKKTKLAKESNSLKKENSKSLICQNDNIGCKEVKDGEAKLGVNKSNIKSTVDKKPNLKKVSSLSTLTAAKTNISVSKPNKVSPRGSMQQLKPQSKPLSSTSVVKNQTVVKKSTSVTKNSVPVTSNTEPTKTSSSINHTPGSIQTKASVNTTQANTTGIKTSPPAPSQPTLKTSNAISSQSIKVPASTTQSKASGVSQNNPIPGRNVAAPVFVPKAPITILKNESRTLKKVNSTESKGSHDKGVKPKSNEVKEDKNKSLAQINSSETHTESVRTFFNMVKNASVVKSPAPCEIVNVVPSGDVSTNVDNVASIDVKDAVNSSDKDSKDNKPIEKVTSEMTKDSSISKDNKLKDKDTPETTKDTNIFNVVETSEVIKESANVATNVSSADKLQDKVDKDKSNVSDNTAVKGKNIKENLNQINRPSSTEPEFKKF